MYQSVWYQTMLPENMVDSIVDDIKNTDVSRDVRIANVGAEGNEELNYRNSNINFLSENHWITGFCYHYILQANMSNFNYDIFGFEGNTMQYTEYGKNQKYNWHYDDEVFTPTPVKRKLSFTLQLSGEDEYDGGEFQLLSADDELYTAPKQRGTIIIFDSRAKHRVTKVKSGLRKSLVGWVNGPKWK